MKRTPWLLTFASRRRPRRSPTARSENATGRLKRIRRLARRTSAGGRKNEIENAKLGTKGSPRLARHLDEPPSSAKTPVTGEAGKTILKTNVLVKSLHHFENAEWNHETSGECLEKNETPQDQDQDSIRKGTNPGGLGIEIVQNPLGLDLDLMTTEVLVMWILAATGNQVMNLHDVATMMTDAGRIFQ
jgi:hypothetical protein